MLEVGYLKLNNPIALICSNHRSNHYSGTAGLLMLDDLSPEELFLPELQASLKEASTASSLGFSTKCPDDEQLLEAARFAGRNHCLLELDVTEGMQSDCMGDLLTKIKGCGTTVSVRIGPQGLTEHAVRELKSSAPSLLHLDLRGMDGVGPKIVKKIFNARGPRIMALGEVEDFEDARSLLAMGADLVSIQSPDPEFANWLSKAMKEYEHLSGWYNAPKHICSGGDLRGLSFCCPPVKRCPVIGALQKAGMTPEEFVARKLELAKGTPLEGGEGTCFGSLVWCCKASKPCYLRDAFLQRIGLSSRDYMMLKRKLAEQLLEA